MINIKDKNLLLFLQTVLNKKYEDICLEDLEKIKTLNFDSVNLLDGTENKIDLSVLSLFPNLEELNMCNTVLSTNDLQYINASPVTNLYLKRCTFESTIDYSLLNKIVKLSLYNSFIENYEPLLLNLKCIKTLEIINPADENEIDINQISTKIIRLVLDKCIVINVDSLRNFTNCELLSLLGTYLNNSDLSFFGSMTSLKELFVSKEYFYDDRLDILRDNVNIKYNLNELVVDEIETRTK